MPEPEPPREKNEEKMEYRPYEWMLRPCELYKEEYDDCKCMQGRFHQYFVFGKWKDCSQWKEDYHNCYLWKKYKSNEAFNELIESEKKRRLERLKGHYQNDVWQRRDKPPENWNTPLPEWMQEEFKGSYLSIKSEEFKQGSDYVSPMRSCTIL